LALDLDIAIGDVVRGFRRGFRRLVGDLLDFVHLERLGLLLGLLSGGGNLGAFCCSCWACVVLASSANPFVSKSDLALSRAAYAAAALAFSVSRSC